MISSHSAGKAMQWLFAYGWTIQRMTSIKGESRFIYYWIFLCQDVNGIQNSQCTSVYGYMKVYLINLMQYQSSIRP